MPDRSLVQPFLDLMHDMKKRDEALRAEFHTQGKFKFIDEQLKNCIALLELDLENWMQQEAPIAEKKLDEHETLVFVHLFNAQGLTLQTWIPMLAAGVFYEYSINRPIYREEEHVKQFLRSKKNAPQHAYFSVVVNQNDILSRADVQDASGQPLIKIKEGSLKRENLRHFFHGGEKYEVEDGEFKKVSS